MQRESGCVYIRDIRYLLLLCRFQACPRQFRLCYVSFRHDFRFGINIRVFFCMSAKELCDFFPPSICTSLHLRTSFLTTSTDERYAALFLHCFVIYCCKRFLAAYCRYHSPATSRTIYLTRFCYFDYKWMRTRWTFHCLGFVSVSGEGSTHPIELSLFPWQPSPNRKWSFCKTTATRWVASLHKWCCETTCFKALRLKLNFLLVQNSIPLGPKSE